MYNEISKTDMKRYIAPKATVITVTPNQIIAGSFMGFNNGGTDSSLNNGMRGFGSASTPWGGNGFE